MKRRLPAVRVRKQVAPLPADSTAASVSQAARRTEAYPAAIATALPYPPLELADRVGQLTWDDPWEQYERIGASCEWLIRGSLPEDWSSDGRRVLDFGCGVGRVLRHFSTAAERGEFWGCDIDEASIDWCRANLSPPFNFFRNGALPPLPQPDQSFDLIYAMSVFTHLLDSWSAWLLELRRLLRPGGYLVASFMGRGMLEWRCGEAYDESLIGANQVQVAAPWSRGGPSVFHSPWWLRAHWGRAFEIVAISESTTYGEDASQGIICLRKDRRPPPTIAELEQPEPDEPREFAAQRHNIDQLKREIADCEARLAECEARQAIYEESASWRVTRPLRELSRSLRKGRGS